MRCKAAAVALAMALFSASLAQAQTEETASAVDADIVTLEAQAEVQDGQLAQQVQEVAAVGADLQDTQAEVDGAQARSQQLSRQAGEAKAELRARRRGFAVAEARYKEQLRAAYKGDNLEGLVGVLDSVLSADGDSKALTHAQMRNVLVRSQQRMDEYSRARQKLESTLRQVTRTRTEYKKALKEKRVRTQKLQRQEKKLEASISRVREDRRQTGARIQQLREIERRRILDAGAATGGSALSRNRELWIARNEIVARPVEPITKKHYRKLYRQSAKKYGFAKDWYILAAVGKVETNHGENMGPSSAGAMGPMQFMPSTWKTSGVDGNGDGVANVMDPRDAIPAAAKYLTIGGAPGDWYAALYSYNHANWYVKKVLGVAEGYRRLEKDNRVGPYV